MNTLRTIQKMTREGETSAAALVRYFGTLGIDRNEINRQHLTRIHQELPQLNLVARNEWLTDPVVERSGQLSHEPVCAVIIETRKHRALEFVVNSFARQLNIPIQLFHGKTNGDFIRQTSLSRLENTGQLRLTQLDADEFRPQQYNALLLNRFFWESLEGRNKILVFQTDSCLCTASPYSLADFAGFDYIGSSWQQQRPIGLNIGGGSGGLSLRDWSSSVRCLQRFPPSLWPGGEDGYFAFHLDIMGGLVGQPEDCARFSSQSEFFDGCFGVHKISIMSETMLDKLFTYCPQARNIL